MRFQSTLPRGERRNLPFKTPRPVNYFNPRSREGSDVAYHHRMAQLVKFQSTLPRGERPQHLPMCKPARSFQSTLPRGERLQCRTIVIDPANFNPRSREGSDDIPCYLASIQTSYFNPRSREGSDEDVIGGIHQTCQYFNPRSREGSDWIKDKGYDDYRNFNPRSREGSDAQKKRVYTYYNKFQSTLPRGERRQNCPNILCDFQQFAHFFIHNLLLQANFPSILSIS